jgi:cobalt/nickel transport system permease protein
MDGVLSWPWLVGGFAGMVALGLIAVGLDWLRYRLRGQELREEEVARVALLTAAFFVASQIHVRVGPTSVHLLLNGLLGVVLGWRAALAIPVGLFLQAALFGHGGFSTLGINSCVQVLPALLAWLLFHGLAWTPGVRRTWFRAGLVAVSVLVWTLSSIYSIALLVSNPLREVTTLQTATADSLTFHPAILIAALVLAVVAAWAERRLENAPEFPLGLLVGEVTVLATLFLNALVLVCGGPEDWHSVILIILVAHLPIAVIEGIVLGFLVGFLARVKPEMLGWSVSPFPAPALPLEKAECSADPL